MKLTYYHYLKAAVKKYPNKVFLKCNKQQLTYIETYNLVIETIAKLTKLGLKRRDNVALYSTNSIEFIIYYLATNIMNVKTLLLSYHLDEKHISDLSTNFRLKMILFGNGKMQEDQINEIGKKLNAKEIIDIRKQLDIKITDQDLKEANKLCKNSKDSYPSTVIFTSGSEAKPKAVMLTQKSLLSSPLGYHEKLIDSPNNKCLIAVPLFHCYGLFVFLWSLINKTSSYFVENLNPEKLLEIIKNEEITILSSVPVILNRIISLPNYKKELTTSLKIISIAGGFTSDTQLEKYKELFPSAFIANGYGQTESSSLISITYSYMNDELIKNSIGKPIKGLKVKILNKKLKPLKNGLSGQIAVKGKTHMKCYFGLSKEKQPFTKNKYLLTGDLGYFDNDGNLFYIGRITDNIIKNGENISSKEIEDAIRLHSNIKSVKVLGLPDPNTGEKIVACISLNDKNEFDEKEFSNFLKDKISSFKIPSEFKIYDELPINPTGKINKTKLLKDLTQN